MWKELLESPEMLVAPPEVLGDAVRVLQTMLSMQRPSLDAKAMRALGDVADALDLSIFEQREGSWYCSAVAKELGARKRGSERGKGAAIARWGQVPFEDIVHLYNDICRSYPRLHFLCDDRKKKIASCWNKSKTYQDLRFWEWYFRFCEADEFLSGRDRSSNFKPTFETLFRPSLFQGRVEKYMAESEK